VPTATAAVSAADHEPFVLQGIEVGTPLRGAVLRCVVPSRRAGAHTAVTGTTTDVAGAAPSGAAPRAARCAGRLCGMRTSFLQSS
jgi:hypothetical protein